MIFNLYMTEFYLTDMRVCIHFWGQCGGKNNEHTKMIVVLENRPNPTHFVAVFSPAHDKWGRQADESRSYKFYMISSNIFPVHYDVFQPKTNWYLLDAFFLSDRRPLCLPTMTRGKSGLRSSVQFH